MHGSGGEVQEEWLIGRNLPGVGNEADRFVHQVFGEMIALLRRLFRLDLVVVVDQLRIILVRVAAQEAVETLKTAPKRPSIIRSSR